MTTISTRLCLPLALALFAGCDIAGCDQEPTPPSGELDRLGDLVLVTPSADDSDRSFVVVTNPEIQQLRVFDVLERRFVAAPNVFFPLSARTGPATRRLAVAPADPRFVYALDGAADLVQMVAMVPLVEVDEDTNAPAFTTAGVLATGRAPSDVAVWSAGIEGEPALAFVTLPEQSAVQVLAIDVEAGVVVEELLVALEEGSHPNRVEVDPTGDAVVVTDAALDSIAILRIRPDDVTGEPLAALDRRLDVGGPTQDVAIGRVDPGDGLGPLALVSHRNEGVLTAVRLFRPDFREDRYEVIGSVEIPGLGSTLYVPDQARENPRACCPLLSLEQVDPDPPTFAWGSVATPNGFLYYVRFDAPRAGGGRLVRLIDFGTPAPGAVDDLASDDIWFPAPGGGARRPTVGLVALDNYGEPPRFPLLTGQDPQIVMLYEGSPPGTSNRRAELIGVGDGFALVLVPASIPFEERDVEPGDEIVVDTSDRGGSCPDSVSMTVESVEADTVVVSGLTSGQAACVSQGGELRFDLFASGDFIVSTTSDGYQGRLPVTTETTFLEVPSFRVSVSQSAAGPPLRGSEVRIDITQGINPVAIHLARRADFRAGGLGQTALLPQAMAGGSVQLRDLEGTVSESTRMFIATGTGGLLVFEEAAVNVDVVVPFN